MFPCFIDSRFESSILNDCGWISLSGRSFEKRVGGVYIEVFATDHFKEMIFTFLFFHLNFTNWSLAAEHTGQLSGQTPSDT
jgi:hypothetical protein